MMIDRQIPLLFVVMMLTAVLWACTQDQGVVGNVPLVVTSPSISTASAASAAVPSTTSVAPLPTATMLAVPWEWMDWTAAQGNLTVVGSSTVYPLTKHMAEEFTAVGFTGHIEVQSVGTGAGFHLFCEQGMAEMVNASRPIRVAEIQACRANGREPLELRVGTDALAVVVNPANDFVDTLSLAELRLLFSTAETWADVRPTWPREPILRFIPGTDSGTFDYFVEQLFESNPRPVLAGRNLVTSEDDYELVRGVESHPYAVGFFGYAYYLEEQTQLRLVPIEGIDPNPQVVENGVYPFARPLFVYTTAEIMDTQPQVAAFLHFYLTHVNDEIGMVGYFPISEEQLTLTRLAWWLGNE